MKDIAKAITNSRKKCGFTQEAFAEKIGVTAQAVSKWETGKALPDIENLLLIAEITNTPYGVLFGDGKEEEKTAFLYRNRLFHEENMYTRMRTVSLTEGLDETYRALPYMRERHMGQFRKKNKYATENVLYINHPLMMACHAHAMGIREDALLAAILLHDVVEDTGVTADELPFSDAVKETVSLVSFSVPDGMDKKEAKDLYYAKIAENPHACVVKLIDRCNNVSTMCGCFTREKIIEYVEETEKYVLPLTDIVKNRYPKYSDVAFITKYQILGILESVKYMV